MLLRCKHSLLHLGVDYFCGIFGTMRERRLDGNRFMNTPNRIMEKLFFGTKILENLRNPVKKGERAPMGSPVMALPRQVS